MKNVCESVHWIQVAEDGVQSWSLTNFLVSVTIGSVLPSAASVSCQEFCCMKIVKTWSTLLTSWSIVLRKLNSPLASQEICIIWNPKVHCHVHISLTLIRILSQFSLFCILALYLRPVSILFFHLCLVLPSSLFPSGLLPTMTYEFIFSPCVCCTFPIHLINLHLFIVIEEYKPCNSWLCN